ncbi:MAG: RNA polymerase sigma factor [Bacteroidales bacterium]|nr:RNA polymerase sigma factor [Bacteroidales bacterium]
MKDYSSLNDLELIGEARKGNEGAFATLITRYEQQVAKTVLGMLGNTPEADDIGQETFVRFYRSLHNFRGDSGLGTYLTRIAINLSLNELKRRKRSRSLFFSANILEEKEFDQPDPEDVEDSRDTKEIVQKALQSLEPKFRSVVVLRLLDQYSTKETAEILDLPTGTVLSRLARAQTKLKSILDKLIQLRNGK